MNNIQNTTQVYYQNNTKNKSFLDIADFLKRSGRKNYAFHLVLFDPDLYNIDPYDPNLNAFMKQKILYECMRNYWYWLRECVRIPDQGSTSGGVRYKLDRNNLAVNFCKTLNINIYDEVPRQFGKTIGICCRLLWEHLYGTTNSMAALFNKQHSDSKLNLQRMKDIRNALPEYLRMEDNFGISGKKVKVKNNLESMTNPVNNNSISTFPAARNKINAAKLGRGCTIPTIWYDEHAFIPFNEEIFLSATPAYSKASQNAMRNGAPYGIIITTTPGPLTTDEGVKSFNMRNMATPFDEEWYDYSANEIFDIINQNHGSTFVHIRYNHIQLGAGEEYLDRMIKEMGNNWEAIRREVLLEWAEINDNSPFRKEDLETIKSLTIDPINKLKLCKYYNVEIFDAIPDSLKYPPIIGVDVGGGLNRDSSAITVIDSRTTKVSAIFNCNFIKPHMLAALIVELVTKIYPNAVVNIERNGGYGASVIALLMNSPIKSNLFYEYKDKVVEERYDGYKMNQTKVKTKVYGLDSSKTVRNELMEILRQRVENHKDKFVSKLIYEELNSLEIKPSGKVEHTKNGHDDQLFSYLMALYVWYNGVDLMNRWGIRKSTLITDENIAEEQIPYFDEDNDVNITSSLMQNSADAESVASQLEFLGYSRPNLTIEQHRQMQYLEDEQSLIELLKTPLGKRAYKQKYPDLDDSDIDQILVGQSTITQDIVNDFYGISGEVSNSDPNKVATSVEDYMSYFTKHLDN